jgi:CDGSH-type Zn-finger protein
MKNPSIVTGTHPILPSNEKAKPMTNENPSTSPKKIIVKKNGPYLVKGGVPLLRKTQVVSEYGEPLTWQKVEDIPSTESYILCRCGASKKKPFCDGKHTKINFDGTETADTNTKKEREYVVPGGVNIVVRFDPSLCMDSGFCGNRNYDCGQLVAQTADTVVRSHVIAMVERCPSGALTYSMREGEPEIEPDLPEHIAATTEITSKGPIEGPIWITGSIPVERSDGQPFETRPRVTLCNCGRSKKKPLCDGTHRPKDE